MESIHPIKAYRLRHDPPLLIKQLAEKIGVDKGTVSRWETGERKPDQILVPVISRVTGIPPGVLRPDLAFMFAASAPVSAKPRGRRAA